MNKDEIITKTIEECISKNILKDYLKEHESEVRSMIDMEAEQEFATRCYGKEMYNDGKAEGIAVGKAEGIAVGKEETYVLLFKQGLISEEIVLSNLNITKEELKKLLV